MYHGRRAVALDAKGIQTGEQMEGLQNKIEDPWAQVELPVVKGGPGKEVCHGVDFCADPLRGKNILIIFTGIEP